MPSVLNIHHLPGYYERMPIIPAGAVYIGRANQSLAGLPDSKWRNLVRAKAERVRQAEAELRFARPAGLGSGMAAWRGD